MIRSVFLQLAACWICGTQGARIPARNLAGGLDITSGATSIVPTTTVPAAPQVTKREEDPLVGPGDSHVSDILIEGYGQGYSIPTTSLENVQDGKTTWTASNTDKVAQVYTTTVSGTATTVSTDAGLSLAQATKAADGLDVGDWSVVMTPAFWTEVEDIVSKACSLTKRADPSDDNFGPTCANSVFKAYPDRFKDAVVKPIRDLVIKTLGLLPETEVSANTAIAGAALAIAMEVAPHMLKTYNRDDNAKPHRIYEWFFKKTGVEQAQSQAAKAKATTTSSSKPPCKTGMDMPMCYDADCKGDDKKKCTADGDNKDCQCAVIVKPIYDNFGNSIDWLNNQQTILQAYEDAYEDEPWCLHGASPNGGRSPKEYCQCGDNHATIYPVATSTDNPCPYAATSHPDSTIVFSTDPPPTMPAKTSSPSNTPTTTTTSSSASSTPPDDKYFLAIVQQMELSTSSVTWRLTAPPTPVYSSGQGSPITGAPTDLWMTVTNPTNINDTHIEWGYIVNGKNQKTLFSTGTQNKGYADQIVEKDWGCTNTKHELDQWKKWNAGYRREFTCIYVGHPPK